MMECAKNLLVHVEHEEPRGGLAERLRTTDRPLLIKLGVDPTSPHLHWGHGVVLRALRRFQDAGHTVCLVVGDMTAYIGDPTGRNVLRPPLSKEDITSNAKTYLDQAGFFLRMEDVRVEYNSRWLEGLTLYDLLPLFSSVGVAALLQRKDFKNRMESSSPLFMHELTYPLLQGYDSVHLKADVEIGGTDQLFNCLMGRTLQQKRGIAPQVVLTYPLLVGLDGVQKMSKSLGNAVVIKDDPYLVYARLMSLPDSLVPTYGRLLLDRTFSLQNPLEEKKFLAHALVQCIYGKSNADNSQEKFYKTVQKKDHDYKKMEWLWKKSVSLLDVCFFVTQGSMTRTHLRTLFQQGGVRVNGVQEKDGFKTYDVGDIRTLSVGKRTHVSFCI